MEEGLNLLLIGCGGVGKAVLELLFLEKINVNRLVIIEPKQLPEWIKPDIHIMKALTKENVNSILEPLLKSRPFIIDVSINVDAPVELVKKYGCNYINTSLEGYTDKDVKERDIEDEKQLKESVLFFRHNKAKKKFENTKSRYNPSVLVDNGANPGLVNNFVKQLLEDVATKYNDEESLKDIKNQDFHLASKRMGLQVCHISEIDTQDTREKLQGFNKDVVKMYGSWSPCGFYEECVKDFLSIGYGSQENQKSKEWKKLTDAKNNLVRVINKRPCDVKANSYCPNHKGEIMKYCGYVIPHGENYEIAKLLKHNDYQVSVYYVYGAPKFAVDSIDRIKANDYKEPEFMDVLRLDEMRNGGFDSVGVCCFFSGQGSIPKIAHWYGSSLSIEDVKKLGISYSNPTVVQVATSIISGILYILSKHKNEGFLSPEDMDYKFIIDCSKKYLGNIHSISFNYDEKIPLTINCFLVKAKQKLIK